MDTADKFINNRSPKITAVIFVCLTAVSLLAAFLISDRCARIFVGMQVDSILSAVSGQTDFTSLPSASDIKAGEIICSQYGFRSEMPPELMQSFHITRNAVFTFTSIGFALLCLSGFIICEAFLFKNYTLIEAVRTQCIKISENISIPMKLFGEDSDCIRRLCDSISVLEKQMSHLTEKLQNEKTFLKEFLSDFSHQLKTSIAVIRLNSDMLSCMENLDEQKKTELADEIMMHIDDMETLILSSLRLAKLNADSVVYNKEEGDLTQTCAAAVQRISAIARTKKIKTRLLNSDTVKAYFDKVWLREAIENIIKNSVDHSECTNISIEAKDCITSVSITIHDDGKGIAQQDIPKLFERFGKQTNSSVMTSVGIGMSIANKIVQAHNGQILVYSGTGKGTRFEIILLK